jgi:hypothetical protein
MIITVSEDLSSVTAVAEDGTWLRLSGSNPETMAPWKSVADAESYALSCEGRAGFWNAADVPLDPPDPVPEVISDRQFFEALWQGGHITYEEAEAAVATGAIPATMAGFLDLLASYDEVGAKKARLLLKGATEFRRDNYVVPVFGSMYGMTSAQIDQLWRDAHAL